MADLPSGPVTANGDYDVPCGAQSVRFLSVGGDFDGATVTFKYHAGGTDYVAYDDGVFTVAGGFRAEIPGSSYRITVASAGASTSLNFNI